MYKIAVIEDDTLLGQALVEMLTSHGYQAFAAESVTKARRLLERQPVDLLLIDRGLGAGRRNCRLFFLQREMKKRILWRHSMRVRTITW